MKWLRPYCFWLAVLILTGLRFFHFDPFIDAPHDWRQCDTAWYILDFFRNGIDLLHPAVCWMGAHEVVALEFPLPEALVAVFYSLFGESIPLARFVFLCFFCGAAYYFFLIVELVFDRRLARLATLTYLTLPLGIFYSRAIHIDFSALFFAHGMLYYLLSGISLKDSRRVALSSLFAIPAFLIKAPYVFFLALPILAFAWKKQRLMWLLKRGIFFVPALLLFFLWQQHVYSVNGSMPDWDYILHYRKFDHNASWYFGSLQQRLQLYNWWILFKRGLFEVTGIGGIFFFVLGLFRINKLNHAIFIGSWLLGLVIYLLLFFNLNFVHNYYQIPLLAPAALIIALGLKHLYDRRKILLPLSMVFLIAANFFSAEKMYFHLAETEIEIGSLLRQSTPEEALLIVTFGKMDCRDPRLLYRARRRGWSVEELALNTEVISRLWQEEGATHWAYAGTNAPDERLPDLVASLKPPTVLSLNQKDLSIFLFELE